LSFSSPDRSEVSPRWVGGVIAGGDALEEDTAAARSTRKESTE